MSRTRAWHLPLPRDFWYLLRWGYHWGFGLLKTFGLAALTVAMMVLGARDVRASAIEEATAAYQRGDYARAARLYTAMADEGEPMAFSILGLMYSNGQGVGQSYAEAAHWYRLAAEQGVAVSQTSLAGLYFTGKGVPRDVEQAIHWYTQAGEQGDASAQFALGSIFEEGQGVPVDHETALSWYRRAAALGNPSARYSLAAMYENGRGVAADSTRAYVWFDLAASTGWKLAVKGRDRVAKRMTRDQIVQARQMEMACVNSSFEQCD